MFNFPMQEFILGDRKCHNLLTFMDVYQKFQIVASA